MYIFIFLIMLISLDGNGLVYAGNALCGSICNSEDVSVTDRIKCNMDKLKNPGYCGNRCPSI